MNPAAIVPGIPGPAWQHGLVEARVFEWLDDQLACSVSPLFVGLDGRSGSGKSTLAAAIANHRDDTVVIRGISSMPAEVLRHGTTVRSKTEPR